MPDGSIKVIHQQSGQVWFQVRHSLILEKMGIHHQKGLFAARQFSKGDYIGRYIGEILSRAEGHQRAQIPGDAGRYVLDLVLKRHMSVDASKPVQSDAEQIQQFGEVFISNANFVPGMHAEMANDIRNTGQRSNVKTIQSGWMVASRKIKPGDEIMWSYGRSYWKGR
ncbi:MAG TPA: SET domain-containing protein-lysine N-methyltransferase [Oculatellaceae cyanobacterium]